MDLVLTKICLYSNKGILKIKSSKVFILISIVRRLLNWVKNGLGLVIFAKCELLQNNTAIVLGRFSKFLLPPV